MSWENAALSIEALPGAVLSLSPEGYITSLNRPARKLACKLCSGERFTDRLDGCHRNQLESLLSQDRQEHDEGTEFEICIEDRRYRLTTAGALGAQSARYVQLTDITEYRALSRRVARNEQLYRSLFSQNPDALCRLDLDGRLVEVNTCAELLTGYPKEQLYQHHWESVLDKPDRSSARVSFKAALEGNPSSYRCRITSRGGQTAIAQITYIPIVVSSQVIGVYGVARDKTQRYRLEESRRLLRACLAQIQDVIIITETEPLDPPGPRIVFVNEGVERMTGYRPEEVLGRTPRMFQGPDTDRAALTRIRKALEGRRPIKEELVNYCKDGLPFWNEIEIVPIPARRRGDREYFAAVQRDITQVKQREEELRQSREELRRLNRAQESVLEQERRRIARDLHDELGQTLTAMKLNLGVALNSLDGLSENRIQRLQGLIDFVDGAIEKVREISSNLRPAMLDDLGFEAAAEWFLDRCAGHYDLDIQWHPTPDGSGNVTGETATALFRILQECMTNITRHSQATAVWIDYEETDCEARLSIQDNGIGFDPGSVCWTGFGLVGMRERVSMLNGDLEVESATGKGVRVRVSLPLENKTV